jgi:hypothetical protein
MNRGWTASSRSQLSPFVAFYTAVGVVLVVTALA